MHEKKYEAMATNVQLCTPKTIEQYMEASRSLIHANSRYKTENKRRWVHRFNTQDQKQMFNSDRNNLISSQNNTIDDTSE